MVFQRDGVFRFLDLPGEIRNKIYEELLCSFEPPPPELEGLDRQMSIKGFPDPPTGVGPAPHSIDTAILRASKQVHREAYDVMVKTNQFVYVDTDGLHLANLLLFSQLPIVTMDRAHAKQFHGYALSVKITAPNRGRDPEVADLEDDDPDFHREFRGFGVSPIFNFMILGRDLARFCRIVDERDMYMERIGQPFAEGVSIDIIVNPTPTDSPLYKASITDFFSEKIQNTLLHPFRTYIRTISNVSIRGTVSASLAETVAAEITTPRWPDAEHAIKVLTAKKEKGNDYFRERNFDKAREVWSEACYDIDMIHQDPSWDYLTVRGGPNFLNQLSELFFVTNSNLAQIFINEMMALHQTAGSHDANMTQLFHYALFCLEQANNARSGAPYESATWRPTIEQIVKYAYRRAVSIRLMGNEEMVSEAVGAILQAWHLSPRDEAVIAEKEIIMAWKREVSGELPLLRM